jgi:hypothetical protein
MDATQKRAFLQALKAVGLIKVVIEFAGENDDGQIGSITAQGLAPDLDLTTVPIPDIADLDVPNKYLWNAAGRNKVTVPLGSIQELIEHCAYDLLEETNLDWVNHDGGNGTIIIVPGKDEIAVMMNQRTITYDTSFHHLGFASEADQIEDDGENFY